MANFNKLSAATLTEQNRINYSPQSKLPVVTLTDITYSPYNDLIRGLTKTGIFFQNIVKATGVGTPNKDAFSAWVCGDRFNAQIKVKFYPYHHIYETQSSNPDEPATYSRRVLKFGPIFFVHPHIRVGDKTFPLTPVMCYLLKISYMFEVLMVMNIYEYKTDKHGTFEENIDDPFAGKLLENSEPISIGRVPAMVRSKVCNLAGCDERTLIQHGEDLREHGGYFIIDGIPKIIQMAENTKLNSYVFRTDIKSEKKMCSITADNKKGSIVTTLQVNCLKRGNVNQNIKKMCSHPTVYLVLNNLKTQKTNKQISETMNIIRALRLYLKLKMNQESFQNQNQITEKNNLTDEQKRSLTEIINSPINFLKFVLDFIKDGVDEYSEDGDNITRKEKCRRAFNFTIFEALIKPPFNDKIMDEFPSVFDKIPDGADNPKGIRYWSKDADWVILKRKIDANKKNSAFYREQVAEEVSVKCDSNLNHDDNEDEVIIGEKKDLCMLNATMLHCLDSSLLSHEDFSDPMKKVKSVAMMVAQMLEFMVGARKETKRDDWDEKRQKTAAKLCEQLMRGFTKNFINGMTNHFDDAPTDKKRKSKDSQRLTHKDFNIECLKTLITQPQQITNGFIASFKGPTWGIHTVNVKESPVQAHEEHTYTHALADLDKINSTVNRKVKSHLVRGLQMNQWGFGDPAANPDNINTGIVKEKAITAILSTYSSESIINRLITEENRIRKNRKQLLLTNDNITYDINSPLVINGIYKCFCNAKETQKFLRDKKRNLEIPYQTSIFLDEHEYLLVHTDEGRLLRPVFVVEKLEDRLVPKAYKLVTMNGLEQTYLDFLNSLSPPTRVREEALKNGVIEYIDAKEQNRARIALNKKEIDEYSKDIERLKKFIEEKQNEKNTYLDLLRNKIYNIEIYDKNLKDVKFGKTLVENERNVENSAVWNIFFDSAGYIKNIETDIRNIVTMSIETVDRQKKRGKKLSDVSNENYLKLLVIDSELKKLKQLNNAISSMEYELEVQSKSEYDFMEIHPCALHGPILNITPYLGFQQGPRQSFQYKMAQQGMDMAFTNYQNHFQDNAKILQNPTRPLVITHSDSALYTDAFPNTVTVQMAQYPISGSTIEDSFGIALDSRHKFDIVHQFVIEKTFKPNIETLKKPIPRENEDISRYQFLTKDGLPMLGAPMQTGDVIIGISMKDKNRTTGQEETRNTSMVLESGQYGTVSAVYVSNSSPLHVRVILHRYRTIQIPDKLSSRFSQKGTCGYFFRNSMLPFNSQNGMISEMYVNPHSVPNRMTGGYIIEPLASTEVALTGIRMNAAPYTPSYLDQTIENLSNLLVNDESLDPTGYSKLTLPFTGLETKYGVFSGPIAIQPLNHLGPEKLQIRGLSNIKKVYDKQAPKGKFGGRKVGEMERNALAGWGVSNILNQLMIEYADGCQMPFCETCGNICHIDVDARSTFSNITQKDAISSVVCVNCDTKDQSTQIQGEKLSKPVKTPHKNPYVYNLLSHMNFAMLFDMKISFNPLDTQKQQLEDHLVESGEENEEDDVNGEDLLMFEKEMETEDVYDDE
jgi:DNA-directed RNA polymerase beta subunit